MGRDRIHDPTTPRPTPVRARELCLLCRAVRFGRTAQLSAQAKACTAQRNRILGHNMMVILFVQVKNDTNLPSAHFAEVPKRKPAQYRRHNNVDDLPPPGICYLDACD